VRRGEIRWYKFGKPDKRRPVVVLTRESSLEFLGEATVAPVTRTVRNIPSEVLLSTADGLPSECAINLDHIQTVTKSKLGGLIAKLDENKMADVRRALLFALGF
jgi:mRNA interferase MazF